MDVVTYSTFPCTGVKGPQIDAKISDKNDIFSDIVSQSIPEQQQFDSHDIMSAQSSLPPLPPGLPPKPVSDLYRPAAPPAPRHIPRRSSPEQFDMYTFHGNGYSSRDAPRPSASHRSRSPPRRESPSRQIHGGDSYRPVPRDFSFRSVNLPSIQNNIKTDSYRPESARSGENRSDHHESNSRAQDRSRRGGRGRPGARGAARNYGAWSQKAADRPFLLTSRASTPELMPGMDEADGPGVKYLALEDLSDSDEAEMDVSSDEGNEREDLGSEEQPKKKQARTGLEISADSDSVPKWSNPDPYTVLPPPDESQRKKKDVVKLIRKARIVTSLDAATKTEAVTDDFISFDFNDDATEESDHGQNTRNADLGNGVPGAPKGPRGLRIPDDRQYSHNSNQSSTKTSRGELDISSDPYLGSRKRNIDDELKDLPPVPMKTSLARPKGCSIVTEWQAIPEASATPWCTIDHAATENMGYWLHKEIFDFYHHVKPSKFEDSVRFDLVDNLNVSIKRKWGDASIQPFGSFVAGLYLPTADMDLVFCSDSYLSGNFGKYNKRNFYFMFRDFLVSEGIPVPGSVEVIPKAKVPLVKYVDYRTGLRVDISFENDTGLIANKTFKQWKAQYPAMPILVTVVKQFLAMRRLNEPVNGGIGGFSVTCLVISLLQLLPQVQSGNMIPEDHLGEVLMEFLDLYGNEFNAVTTAIQFNPPGYVPKNRLAKVVYNKRGLDTEKLSIVDPNNDRNDIAGGSSNTPQILKAFSEAYKTLQERMYEVQCLPISQRHGLSILGAIVGGNYSSFDIQREHLRKCYHS